MVWNFCHQFLTFSEFSMIFQMLPLMLLCIVAHSTITWLVETIPTANQRSLENPDISWSKKGLLLKVNASTRTILVTICSEGYFQVYFLLEDYFEDYFQIWLLFSKKIVFKIVSRWEINLKITLRACSSKGRIVILGRIVSASWQIFRSDFRPQDEIFRPGTAFRPLDE